jgi:hypothetical protein
VTIVATQPHTFSVGGFLFTGYDEFGCLWTVSESDGWFTGGETRSNSESRAQQNGSWRGRPFRDGRVIVLRGQVAAPSTGALELAGRRLSALLADGSFDEFAGSSAAGVFTSWVQRDATPQFTPISDLRATYQVALGSEDPRLYGAAWIDSTTLASAVAGAGRVWNRVWPRDWGVPAGVTPGAVSVPNDGLAPYWPKLRIDGPVTNPVIRCVETGDSIKVNATIAAGQWFDLDCGERHFTFGANADDVRYLVDVSGSALIIPPGGATLTLEADSGTAATMLTVNGYEGAYE